MAIKQTNKHELTYDTETKQYIFNGRNRTSYNPVNDPMRAGQLIEFAEESSTKHHLEITILTGNEHNLETTAVLDGVEVKHITPSSIQEAKLLTFPNLEEIPFTEFSTTLNKIMLMEALGYVTESGQYLMDHQDFGEMPWTFVNSTNPEDSITISAQDVGLKSASGHIEIAPDQSYVTYIFNYE